MLSFFFLLRAPLKGSKWHSDGWQKQIHGQPLVYFGERPMAGNETYQLDVTNALCKTYKTLLSTTVFMYV